MSLKSSLQNRDYVSYLVISDGRCVGEIRKQVRRPNNTFYQLLTNGNYINHEAIKAIDVKMNELNALEEER